MDLQECRDMLDAVDRQLVELFEERMKICGEVAEYKIRAGRDVYDSVREQEKISAVKALVHGDFNGLAVEELFRQMMTISRRYQYQLLTEHGKVESLGFERVESLPLEGKRVVHQGVEGAYSHEAALRYFGKEADIYHVKHFEDAMKAVQNKEADYAVLPIENSSAGAVIDNYDLMVNYKNYIVAETFVPVRHALLGLPGTRLSEVKTVFSHPQALMQCSTYLNKQADWKQISLENTAVAAKKLLEDGDRSQAAIASEIAGELYGLTVLKHEINTNKENTTRFVILSSLPIYRRNAGKVSISFELPHKSGTLYNILSNIIFNGVNMFNIESRPIPGRKWEYRFFIDMEGNLDDASVKNALRGIDEEALNLRILGNY